VGAAGARQGRAGTAVGGPDAPECHAANLRAASSSCSSENALISVNNFIEGNPQAAQVCKGVASQGPGGGGMAGSERVVHAAAPWHLTHDQSPSPSPPPPAPRAQLLIDYTYVIPESALRDECVRSEHYHCCEQPCRRRRRRRMLPLPPLLPALGATNWCAGP
jgi:hypothetical protein